MPNKGKIIVSPGEYTVDFHGIEVQLVGLLLISIKVRVSKGHNRA